MPAEKIIHHSKSAAIVIIPTPIKTPTFTFNLKT